MITVKNYTEIPADIVSAVLSEYNAAEKAIRDEIAEGCVAEGYPQYGSNFELRFEARQDELDELIEDLYAQRGYRIVGDEDEVE